MLSVWVSFLGIYCWLSYLAARDFEKNASLQTHLGNDLKPRKYNEKLCVHYWHGNFSSVAGLEKKLDDIVNILNTSNHIPKTLLAHRQSDLPLDFNSAQPPRLLDHVIEQDPDDETPRSSASDLRSTSISNGTASEFYSTGPSLSGLGNTFDLDDDYSHALLAIFRCDMAPYCPFVLIPSNISPRQFQAERPFLWKAVITAASHRNPTFQDAFGVRSFENFITELLLRGQTGSLDKLQALLVHLGWYFKAFTPSPISFCW